MTSSETAIKPLIVTPEEASHIRPFGLDMQVLLASEQTGGAISVIVACHKPGEGPPDHLHHTQEECIFILEGSYEVTIADVTRIAGPGTMLFIPRKTVHRFKNIGTTFGRMLDWSLPGGQDKYFRAISDLAPGSGFSHEKMMELSEKYHTNFLS
jgi:quercetin dioxygenase-like cupin family protein